MFKCKACGGLLTTVYSGGCGGRGTTKKCTKCDTVFRQATGGILATPGGETWERSSGGRFETLIVPDAGPGELLAELARAKRAEARKKAKRGKRKKSK